MNWDHLHTFYILSEHGSLTSAAKELGIDPTTVSRRIAALESSLNIRLIRKEKGQLVPTRASIDVLNRISRMAGEARQLTNTNNGKRAGSTTGEKNSYLSGTVRITSVESLIVDCLVPELASLYKTYPKIQLELIGCDENVSFHRKNADIAIRLAKPKNQQHVVSKRLTRIGFALYGSKRHIKINKQLQNQKGCFLAYSDEYSHLPEMRWIAQYANGKSSTKIMSSNASVLYDAIRRGVGIGILPCYRGDSDRSLIRLTGTEPIITRTGWLMVRKEASTGVLIRGCAEWLESLFSRKQVMISGIQE